VCDLFKVKHSTEKERSMLQFITVGGKQISPVIDRLILSGFAGRNTAEVEAHIVEMARQGVARPVAMPVFWPAAPHLLTQAKAITVYGTDTIPEVEFVLFNWDAVDYVTVGNDQCDIELERAISGEKSKNICPKVLATSAWRLTDVIDNWDELELTALCNGDVLQQDYLSALLRPQTLLNAIEMLDGRERRGRMLYSGTIATKGTLPPCPYEMTISLAHPGKGLRIEHRFMVTSLSSFYPDAHR
jgi:Protein of unknown function (DUF2848)